MVAYTWGSESCLGRGQERCKPEEAPLSFEEAQHVFSSDDYLEVFDQEHSDTEERFIAIGLINRGLIVVVWTQTEENEIWIMSARFATKREAGFYESYRGKEHE